MAKDTHCKVCHLNCVDVGASVAFTLLCGLQDFPSSQTETLSPLRARFPLPHPLPGTPASLCLRDRPGSAWMQVDSRGPVQPSVGAGPGEALPAACRG